MTPRGHTLLELLVSLVLISFVAGSAALLTASARDDDRVAQAYETDLRHVREATDRLAADIRSASSCESKDGVLVIDDAVWSSREGALYRDHERIVTGIGGVSAEVDAFGLVILAVTPEIRREGARPRPMVTTVRRRVETSR